MGNDLTFQRHQVSLVTKKEMLIVPKYFADYSWYHRLENDCFMYSIHNLVKDETPTQLVDEPSTDMMCIFYYISFMDDLPKNNQYDEDYIKMDFPKQSTRYCWEGEDQLQFKDDSQPVHRNYDNNEQNA